MAAGSERWAFIDIGNVIWCDDDGDDFTLANIGAALARRGLAGDRETVEAAQRRAVASYAPSAWRAAIWDCAGGDRRIFDEVLAETLSIWDGLSQAEYRAWTRPYPGVPEAIAGLTADGYSLALASNNTPRALTRLDELGLLEHFRVREVSDTLGLAKPDTRFFLALLEAAGCDPGRVVMVGDRPGNDIAPARLLGMKSVRVLTGWHRGQEPRGPGDLADLSIADPAAFGDAVRRLLP